MLLMISVRVCDGMMNVWSHFRPADALFSMQNNAGASLFLPKEKQQMHISNLRAFIGTYTVGTESKGIYALRFAYIADDTRNQVRRFAEKSVLPTYQPSDKHFYAVEESFGDSEEKKAAYGLTRTL